MFIYYKMVSEFCFGMELGDFLVEEIVNEYFVVVVKVKDMINVFVDFLSDGIWVRVKVIDECCCCGEKFG